MATDRTEQTFFKLPDSPDAISVLLPPAQLRRQRYSALDFSMARRAAIEYIKTYYSDTFNDFVASDGMIMLIEVVAAAVGRLSLRGDLLYNNCFIGSATSLEAVDNLIGLINQRSLRQTAAYADFELTVESPVITDIRIPAGQQLTATGSDGSLVVYELYSTPGDYSSDIIIPAGKRGVIAFGLEGSFATPLTFVSSSTGQQSFSHTDATLLESPLLVEVSTDGAVENWRITFEPLERYGPNDKVVEISIFGDTVTFKFGDDVNGKSLIAGQQITIRYRSGGGTRGRIGVGKLNTTIMVSPEAPVIAPVAVSIRNITPSTGGTDRESLDQVKRRAPREFAMAGSMTLPKSIVNDQDYAHAASSFSHAVFGTVAKAAAVLKSSRNANLVELYCLAYGSGDQLATPSIGLKQALTTYITDLNVATDVVEVLDGAVKSVDLEITVVMSRGADATAVKSKVDAAISDFFALSNWEMGQPLYVSDLTKAISNITGVKFVDVFAPSDNILETNQIAGAVLTGVGYNELIVLGQKNIKYYYEKTR